MLPSVRCLKNVITKLVGDLPHRVEIVINIFNANFMYVIYMCNFMSVAD